MCGRFTLRTPQNVLLEQFQLATGPVLSPRFNIAPTQTIATVRCTSDEPQRQLVLLRWGLIPSWAKDPSIGNRMINARGESVADKPAFRAAFKRRRCLVLTDGYYEWQTVGKKKQPFLFHMQDDRPFAFAGLWESWPGGKTDDEPGQPLETCTIITTAASDFTRPIHDRMPVILEDADFDLWLDPNMQDREQLEPLLQPFDSADLTADPVSTHVNSPKNDDPQCVELQRELF
jgi:putative SOS response-associated peptidase YedK